KAPTSKSTRIIINTVLIIFSPLCELIPLTVRGRVRRFVSFAHAGFASEEKIPEACGLFPRGLAWVAKRPPACNYQSEENPTWQQIPRSMDYITVGRELKRRGTPAKRRAFGRPISPCC